MASRFVRSSKYRHVFGRPTRKEQCYDNLRISRNAWDTNLVKANPSYLSVNWESSGGGAFAVIPLEEKGRVSEHIPLFRGHTATVLDTDWSPFNDSLIASGSDDGKVFLWKVPDGFTLQIDSPDDVKDVTPVSKLTGHTRKVGQVLFNPSAENVLATASGDFTVKIWDAETGSSKLTLKLGDVIQSLSWSANGALLVTTSRDKKLRLWDVRQQTPVYEGPGHQGAKNSRAVWMGEHDRVATTGFSRMSDRQLALWDIKNPKEPVGGFTQLDAISGVCMPFWDGGTSMLYLAGKGDGNIRYYEYQNNKFEYLSEYSSANPQRGIAFMPKRGVNMHENEVTRAFKTVNDTYIEPISFIVPRRAEVFQSDVYPPTTGLKPAMSFAEWLDGKDALPPKIDMESLYEGQEPAEVPSDYKPTPVATPIPEPAKKEREPPKVEPTSAPTALRGPPPSMKEQTASIAAMTDKYADRDAQEESSADEEDSSSFEEVPKPVERPVTVKASSPVKPASPVKAKSEDVPVEPKKTFDPIASTPSAPPSQMKQTSTPLDGPSMKQTSTPLDGPSMKQTSTPLDGQTSELAEIKALLSAQNDKLDNLAREVESLKSKIGTGGSG